MFEAVARPWGSRSRAVLLVLTCGKVVRKSSCLDWDRRLEDNNIGDKKRKIVRIWENIAAFCHLGEHYNLSERDLMWIEMMILIG